RKKILAEMLKGGGAFFAHPAAHGQHDSCDHQKCSPNQAMKDKECKKRMNGKSSNWKTESVNLVPIGIPAFGFEMKPATDERKSEPRRKLAPPHQKKMSQPEKFAALKDEPVARNIPKNSAKPVPHILDVLPALEEDLPAAAPVKICWRTLQPHCVSIHDAKYRKQSGKRVADQRGIKVGQISGTKDDQDRRQQGKSKTPRASDNSFPWNFVRSHFSHRPNDATLRSTL